MIRGLRLLPAIAGLLAGCGTHEVHRVSAENYPMKPVRLIEPFGAGGGPDLIARVVSPKLSEMWGQPVTVENHPAREVRRPPPWLRSRRPTGTRCW